MLIDKGQVAEQILFSGLVPDASEGRRGLVQNNGMSNYRFRMHQCCICKQNNLMELGVYSNVQIAAG